MASSSSFAIHHSSVADYSIKEMFPKVRASCYQQLEFLMVTIYGFQFFTYCFNIIHGSGLLGFVDQCRCKDKYREEEDTNKKFVFLMH